VDHKIHDSPLSTVTAIYNASDDGILDVALLEKSTSTCSVAELQDEGLYVRLLVGAWRNKQRGTYKRRDILYMCWYFYKE
jgi:hypothetical protein